MNRHALALCMSAILVGCNNNSAPVSAGAPAPASAPIAAVSPPLPAHHYAIQDGLEYGYEGALSDEDRRQGRVTSPLKMYRFLGSQRDVYQVALKVANNSYVAAECEKPCEYAKIYSFVGDQLVSKEVMRLPEEALLKYVFADAIGGRLKPWRGDKNGKIIKLWVDGDKRKLVVSAAEAP